jgi:hypothetical protein
MWVPVINGQMSALGQNAMLARMRLRPSASFFLLALLLAVLPLHARVLRVEVTSRTDVLNSKIFGDAGAYERITGRVYFSLPVANVHNRRIVDLGNAVNLKDGEVEFSADFVAVRPKDAHKGNWPTTRETRGYCATVSPS